MSRGILESIRDQRNFPRNHRLTQNVESFKVSRINRVTDRSQTGNDNTGTGAISVSGCRYGELCPGEGETFLAVASASSSSSPPLSLSLSLRDISHDISALRESRYVKGSKRGGVQVISGTDASLLLSPPFLSVACSCAHSLAKRNQAELVVSRVPRDPLAFLAIHRSVLERFRACGHGGKAGIN